VLLAGGYLVTEKPNRGLVLTVSARIYVVVESSGGASGAFYFYHESTFFFLSYNSDRYYTSMRAGFQTYSR
jgi:phosphomevalonate kinase